MSNVIDLFTHIVTIDSPSGSESRMRRFLYSWLKSQGFAAKKDRVGNLYARNEVAGSPLLLSAHMDTVKPGIGIKPVIAEGIIKSDGTTILGADNKTAVAAIMTAVEGAGNTKPLELLFTVKEETGGGVELFPFEWLTAKKGVIFDKADPLGGIVLNSPYILNFHVTITGKATHASTPQDGINAFSPAFRALAETGVGQLDNGKTTVNIGLINGGYGINTVPEELTIAGEVRCYDKKLFDTRLAGIRAAFESEAKADGAKITFTTDGYCGGYSFAKDDDFICDIADIYKLHGLPVTYYEHSGISDANVLNEKGIKTVNLTDGGKFPHTKEEQIAVADLEKLVKIVRTCISKL